jgi:hypothetical protein
MQDVAAAGAERGDEALPGAVVFGRRSPPAEQGDGQEDHGKGIEGEGGRDAAQVGDDQPG